MIDRLMDWFHSVSDSCIRLSSQITHIFVGPDQYARTMQSFCGNEGILSADKWDTLSRKEPPASHACCAFLIFFFFLSNNKYYLCLIFGNHKSISFFFFMHFQFNITFVQSPGHKIKKRLKQLCPLINIRGQNVAVGYSKNLWFLGTN